MKKSECQKISPTKVGAQKTRRRLWAKAHSMVVEKAAIDGIRNEGQRSICELSPINENRKWTMR
ncbi:MAG: hypothetical protein RMK89_01435 [Armatimonadota bacterium]|nr:hypothetical protein [Armatimonadota bacterium]MDW8142101.1 hypothetical protein [Armatimonadota bacterium]